ncbi:MAG: glycosyltransferase family 1 protein [Micrococcales bacterium]|nr:glycosyltransferase family 1 protein [Micrococcales bacterium]MCL2667455.1 glycosyltransferase family 1 protein [Micrococcales bacterium]
MKRLAIKWDQVVVDPDGRVGGHDAGATLVRRLLRLGAHNGFAPTLVGPATRRCDGFDQVPLEFVEAESTVVVNLDVLDSMEVWRTLRGCCPQPALMNFQWAPTARYADKVPQLTEALSFALFPTFANSERTASEVREVIHRWTAPAVAAEAQVAWVNLGFRVGHVQERNEPDVPVVLYPAIYLSERKQPKMFLDVVERVHKKVPVRVEMRLHESHLVSELAMSVSAKDWVWVGPLTATRGSYWEALASTTAFLATATEESYGLAYVEALAAGVIGILPDAGWAHALVPEGYPFFWHSRDEAEALLLRAVREPDTCRAELDALVNGQFTAWIADKHDDHSFEEVLTRQLVEWFG